MGRYIFLALMVFAAIVGVRQMTARTDTGEVTSVGETAGNDAAAGASEGVLIDFISRGEAVDIAAAIPKRGLVIVEFTADW